MTLLNSSIHINKKLNFIYSTSLFTIMIFLTNKLERNVQNVQQVFKGLTLK